MVTVVFAISGCLFALGVVLPVIVGARDRSLTDVSDRINDDLLSTVDVVIAAYLEASVIEETVRLLQNQFAANGVTGRVIVVASDDETFNAARAADVVLAVPRSGKPAAVNAGVASSNADIVVLTDANCCIQPDNWPLLAMHGLDTAHLVTGSKRERGSRESLFWKYEGFLKSTRQGDGGPRRTLAVIGEFLAFRRGDYAPIPESSLADDLALALDFDRRNLTVAAVPAIFTIEDPASPSEQWERRVRIACGLLSEAVPRIPQLLRSPVGRFYLTHKVYRVTVGVAAFWLAVVSSSILFRPYGSFFIIGTVTWAILRYRGMITARTMADPIFDIVAMQAIPVAGLYRLLTRNLRRSLAPGWTKVPR